MAAPGPPPPPPARVCSDRVVLTVEQGVNIFSVTLGCVQGTRGFVTLLVYEVNLR